MKNNLFFLYLIAFSFLSNPLIGSECETSKDPKCLSKVSKSQGEMMVGLAKDFMEVIPIEISDYLLGHEKVEGKIPVAQWKAVGELLSKEKFEDLLADNIDFFYDNYQSKDPSKQMEKLEALRNIWATKGREFATAYQDFIANQEQCLKKDETKNDCFAGKTPSFADVIFNEKKLTKLLGESFDEGKNTESSGLAKKREAEAKELRKRHKKQESQCEDVFENYGDLVTGMKGGKFTPKEVSQKRHHISKCIDWCKSNPLLKDRFPELCASDRKAQLTNMDNTSSALVPKDGSSSSKSIMCNILWNQPWVDKKGRSRTSRNLTADDFCPVLGGYLKFFENDLIDSLGVVQGEFEKREALYPMDPNGALSKQFQDKAIGRSRPEDYPEIVRRFAIAKSLEANCANFGSSPKIPTSCGSIPGIKQMKCKKRPSFNKKGLVRSAHALRNLYIRRDRKIQQWEEKKRLAGVHVMESDGSFAGYAAPLLDKGGKLIAAGAFILTEKERHNEELRKIDMEMLSLIKENPLLMADFKEYKDPYRPSSYSVALNPGYEGAKYAYHKTKEFFQGYNASFQEQDLHKKGFIKGLTDFDFKKIDDEGELNSAASPLIKYALEKNSERLTKTLERLCVMPNDKLVRQKFFTTLVNDAFPSLKAAHECELSKLSPEDLKDGLKDAQAGLAMSCMAFMAGGPAASALSAVCGTAYAGFSVWAMGENRKDLGEQQTCLAAIGQEMCGKAGKGIAEVSEDYNISYDEAYLSVALLPAELAGGFFDALDLASGVRVSKSTRGLRQAQLDAIQGSSASTIKANPQFISEVKRMLTPPPRSPEEARLLVEDVRASLRDYPQYSSKGGSQKSAPKSEKGPLEKSSFSKLKADHHKIHQGAVERVSEDIQELTKILNHPDIEPNADQIMRGLELLEEFDQLKLKPGQVSPDVYANIATIKKKLGPFVEKSFHATNLDRELRRLEKISDPIIRAREAKLFQEKYYRSLELLGVINPSLMRKMSSKYMGQLDKLDEIIESSEKLKYATTDELKSSLDSRATTLDFPIVPPEQYKNAELDAATDSTLVGKFEFSLGKIKSSGKDPKVMREELFDLYQETNFELQYLEKENRFAPELRRKVTTLAGELIKPSEEVQLLLLKVERSDDDDVRKFYADRAWELFQKEALDDFDTTPGLVKLRLADFKTDLDQLVIPRSYENTNPMNFDFDEVALIKDSQKKFDSLNEKGLTSGDGNNDSVLTLYMETSSFDELSDTKQRLVDGNKLGWFNDMIKPQKINLETLINDPSLIPEIFKDAPGAPEYELLIKQLKYFKDNLNYNLVFDPGCDTAGNGGYFLPAWNLIGASSIPYSYSKWVHEFQHALRFQQIPDDNMFQKLVEGYKVMQAGGEPRKSVYARRIIEGLESTGFYNERDMERLKHAISTPGMTHKGMDELLSVGMEMDALMSITEKGQVRTNLSEENRAFIDDNYKYVTGYIENELTRKERLGNIAPEEQAVLDEIRKTGKWSTDEKFRVMYLQEEPTDAEGWATFFQKYDLESKADDQGRILVESKSSQRDSAERVTEQDFDDEEEIFDDRKFFLFDDEPDDDTMASGGAIGLLTDAVRKGDLKGSFSKSRTGDPMLTTENGVFYFKGDDTFYSDHDTPEITKVD